MKHIHILEYQCGSYSPVISFLFLIPFSLSLSELMLLNIRPNRTYSNSVLPSLSTPYPLLFLSTHPPPPTPPPPLTPPNIKDLRHPLPLTTSLCPLEQILLLSPSSVYLMRNPDTATFPDPYSYIYK